MSGTATSLAQLKQALEECRFEDVRKLLGDLDPEKLGGDDAARVLKLLRRKRRFEELATAADVLAMGGHNSVEMRRLLSQALIDQGSLFHGLNILQRLVPLVVDDPDEGPEVRGLIGRAHKQRFVEEGDPKALTEAIEAYAVDGRQAPAVHLWHGINLVACIKRAQREGIAVPRGASPDALARGILDRVTAMKKREVWDLATALEAAIALGNKAEALKWLNDYVKHRDADAFELGSTLRQLEEIWQLGEEGLGSAVVPVLQLELIKRTGGSVGALTKPEDTSGFEKVYGKDAAQSLQWLDSLAGACRAIARVQDEGSGKAVGTGFLVEGSWLHAAWGPDLVFVTNSHVVSEDDGDALKPEDAVVEFTRMERRPRAHLGELLFTSPREALDVSVLRVDAPEGSSGLRLTEYVPTTAAAEPSRVYVVGHPGGRELEVTLYDNQLREGPEPYVHYRCPTEGGSSGSPVMNSSWKVFGLHHRAVKEKQFNEGVRFEAIRRAIRGA